MSFYCCLTPSSAVFDILIFLLCETLLPVTCRLLINAVGFGSWSLLLVKAVYTGGVGLLALQMFLSLSTGKDSNSYY